MDNRDLILSRALDLWDDRGYDAVGVQEIVDAAGVTKPTLYYYFGSKRGLLDALIEERLPNLRTALAPAAAYRHDLVYTLESIMRGYFAFAKANVTFYRLLLASSFAPIHSEQRRAALAWHRMQRETLERLFEAAAADHGNMRGRHRAYAASFLGTMNTYVGIFLDDGGELDDQLAYRVVHQFMHGIFS